MMRPKVEGHGPSPVISIATDNGKSASKFRCRAGMHTQTLVCEAVDVTSLDSPTDLTKITSTEFEHVVRQLFKAPGIGRGGPPSVLEIRYRCCSDQPEPFDSRPHDRPCEEVHPAIAKPGFGRLKPARLVKLSRSRNQINGRVSACAVSHITLAEKERPEITKPVATRSVVAHFMPATSSTCDCAQGLTARRWRQRRTTPAGLSAWLDLAAMPTTSRSGGELPAADTTPSSSLRT